MAANRRGSLFATIGNLIWPRMGLGRYGRYLVKRLVRLRAEPHAVAAGVAAGAAVSMFPLVGLHIALAIVLALLTRGNLFAAVVGTVWGNPLTFPAFFAGAYQVGDFLAGRRRLIDTDVLGALGETMDEGFFLQTSSHFWPVFKTMMIGAAPLALLVWVAFYLATRVTVSRLRAARAARTAARGG